MRPTRRDLFLLWLQEHPWARWAGILAFLVLAVAAVVAADFVVTSTCDHGLHRGLANCLSYGWP